MEKSEQYYIDKYWTIEKELKKLYRKYKFNSQKIGEEIDNIPEEILDLIEDLLLESTEVLKKLHIIEYGYEWKDVPNLKIVVNNVL